MSDPTQQAEAPPAPGLSPPLAVRTDGYAIASLVAGILALPAIFLLAIFGVPVAVVAILLAIVSRRRIRESGGSLTGMGLALAGLLAGALAIVVGILQAIALYIFLGHFLT